MRVSLIVLLLTGYSAYSIPIDETVSLTTKNSFYIFIPYRFLIILVVNVVSKN